MMAGIGSLAAAWAVAPLNRRFGVGPAMLGGLLSTGIGWTVIGLAAGPLFVASLVFGLGLFLLDLGAMVFFINYLVLRQSVTHDRLLGRVTATMICLTVSTAPLGGVAGGWIADTRAARDHIACGAGRDCSRRWWHGCRRWHACVRCPDSGKARPGLLSITWTRIGRNPVSYKAEQQIALSVIELDFIGRHLGR